MNTNFRYEGYWYSSLVPELPMPRPDPDFNTWTNKDNFLAALDVVEKMQARVLHYKGWSTCRICQKMNGSREFEYVGWRWPEGLRHYITEHSVRPSTEFEEFILQHVQYPLT